MLKLKKIVIIVIVFAMGFATQAYFFNNPKILSPKVIKSFIKPTTVSSAPNSKLTGVKPTEKTSLTPNNEYNLVTRVVDGDTIQIDTGERVRYIGMDTPETVDPRKPVQCFGHEASDFNKSLVAGKKVRLVKDVSEVDRYGRLLRYVYLPDGTFVNLELVKKGYAHAATFPPDVKYADVFVAAERAAREAGVGLWGGCR